ncbi:hypothetical protein ACFCP7_11775 [Paenibacillus elgii]
MAFEDAFKYHIDHKNHVLSWQVLDSLTVENATQASGLVKSSLSSLSGAKLLVDNRFMIKNGRPVVFSPEVNAIWEQLQSSILSQVSQCAVLCSGTIMKMQMDRIARASGFIHVLQSFWNDDPSVMKKEAYVFLGISSNELIDRPLSV